MNYQRNGISSNTKAGKNFEDIIYNYFDKELGIELEKQKKVEIGINSKKKHSFDFGNNWLLIECVLPKVNLDFFIKANKVV